MFPPPSRSRGLLDKVAGFNSLSFHEQSSSPAFQGERGSWTPRTIKVKPRGKPGHRETDLADDKRSKQWNRKRSERHMQVKTERFDDRVGNRYDTARQETIFRESENHRRILPRNVLHGWNSSTSRVEPMPYITVVGSTYNHCSSPENYSKGYGRTEYEPGTHLGAVMYDDVHHIDQQQFHYLPNGMPFVPMMPFRSSDNLYPPSTPPYGIPTPGFPPRISHSVRMLEDQSHPFQHQSQVHDGAAKDIYEDDSDGIIYLGERTSCNLIDSPGFDFPDLPYLEDRGQASVKEAYTEPSSVEKMDAVVNLMLVAAEVLDMNDVALNDGAASESSVDANNGDRSMSSPSPMSLSPLQTLAKLSTERLNANLAKSLKPEATTTQSDTHKPASIWIRGGQRSRNKDEVDKRKAKPYDRPPEEKASTKGHKVSEKVVWCTDFPSFEKFAAAKSNSSPIRLGVALAQRPSLSDMPPVRGKNVKFANLPESESVKTKSESESTTGNEEGIKPVSRTAKRRRGRPAKVKFEEDAEQPTEQLQKVQSKPSTRVKADLDSVESKSFVTRSGRRVKSVQYDV
ncbi:hypothetical protein QFC21_000579 [Naganishia friedmannii]|uniref:Uncharacterized protein n=1 Tax=Naganishia friedmannii TaxID=89922 RepID=A0ACC2WD27_9TREE|nr:hypothetical protein QFC21_000579 [Naganishia friedmannii]